MKNMDGIIGNMENSNSKYDPISLNFVFNIIEKPCMPLIDTLK